MFSTILDFSLIDNKYCLLFYDISSCHLSANIVGEQIIPHLWACISNSVIICLYRQKVRDQKLSTVLPEDIERLTAEYKRIDAEYKTTNKQIEVLEDRKLQRIKVELSSL